MVIKIPNIPTGHRTVLYGRGKTRPNIILSNQKPPNIGWNLVGVANDKKFEIELYDVGAMAILVESCKDEWRDWKVAIWLVYVYCYFQINHEHVCDVELNVVVPNCSCLIKKDCNTRKVNLR
jgi:hypothetical protein